MELMFNILKNCKLHNDLPFLPDRMKIEKIQKLVANLDDKKEHVIYKKNLKQTLNPGLVKKKCIQSLNFIKILVKIIH